ncbi:MAG TPA: methyltransferase domain-containing protein [Vicinamibacterales bacterium]|jgi:phosphatidylethanolamine/phosphatidyl-N-methylethanolamine N-methyltransferase|nr:methyltransferase domain-containing protein [Vicinamibacterales bacterium]
MALFDRKAESEDEMVAGSDAATRALSVTAVENDFVEGVYDKLAKVYDLIFGPTLHPGRLQAIQRMNIQPGERVLEVGVGTGINLSLYPKQATVTGIDFSSSMLEKARERAARKGLRTMRLLQMDAADLKFADDSFDIVYAPYLISVVPDPVKVAKEMRRVCRPGGRIIFLNHFLSPNGVLSRIERLISPFTIHIGFKADLDLPAFLAQAELQPVSIEKVNVPRIWSLVTCVKD